MHLMSLMKNRCDDQVQRGGEATPANTRTHAGKQEREETREALGTTPETHEELSSDSAVPLISMEHFCSSLLWCDDPQQR